MYNNLFESFEKKINLVFSRLDLIKKSKFLFFLLPLVSISEIVNCQTLSHLGAAKDWQIGFQKPSTGVMEGIISFHDDLFVFLTLILGFVIYVLGVCLNTFSLKTTNGISVRLVHASVLEVIWTIIPALVLIIIAIPSFSLIYSIEEIIEPLYTIKIIGHQWYWSYELVDHKAFMQILNQEKSELSSYTELKNSSGSFDSYMLDVSTDNSEDPKTSQPWLRLLEVDNYLFIPTRIPSRLLISSADVLHSWAVPTLGVKVDACPGRLNQASLLIQYPGVYYGQCSEICGVNHGFMPIAIVSLELSWQPMKEKYTTMFLAGLDPFLSGLSSVVEGK